MFLQMIIFPLPLGRKPIPPPPTPPLPLWEYLSDFWSLRPINPHVCHTSSPPSLQGPLLNNIMEMKELPLALPPSGQSLKQ